MRLNWGEILEYNRMVFNRYTGIYIHENRNVPLEYHIVIKLSNYGQSSAEPCLHEIYSR